MYTIYLSWSTVEPGELPYKVQGLSVLLYLLDVPAGLASGEVVLQVVDLHGESRTVPRIDDVPNIVKVGDALVVAQEHQRVHNMFRESSVPQITGSIVAVFEDIVQESADHLLVIAPGHTDGKGMKDDGTTVEVLRIVVGIGGNLQGIVDARLGDSVAGGAVSVPHLVIEIPYVLLPNGVQPRGQLLRKLHPRVSPVPFELRDPLRQLFGGYHPALVRMDVEGRSEVHVVDLTSLPGPVSGLIGGRSEEPLHHDSGAAFADLHHVEVVPAAGLLPLVHAPVELAVLEIMHILLELLHFVAGDERSPLQDECFHNLSQLMSPESVGNNVRFEVVLGGGEDMPAAGTSKRVKRAAGPHQWLCPSASDPGVVAELLPAFWTADTIKDSHGFK